MSSGEGRSVRTRGFNHKSKGDFRQTVSKPNRKAQTLKNNVSNPKITTPKRDGTQFRRSIQPVKLNVEHKTSAAGVKYLSATPIPTKPTIGSFGVGDVQLKNPEVLRDIQNRQLRNKRQKQKENTKDIDPKDKFAGLKRVDSQGVQFPKRILEEKLITRDFYKDLKAKKQLIYEKKMEKVSLVQEPHGNKTLKELKSIRHQLPSLLNDKEENIGNNKTGFGKIPFLHPELQEKMLNFNYRFPTDIQIIALPILLENIYKWDRKNDKSSRGVYLLAAEAGSGKTLTYLLPIVQLLKYKLTAKDDQIKVVQQKTEIETASTNDHNITNETKDDEIMDIHSFIAQEIQNELEHGENQENESSNISEDSTENITLLRRPKAVILVPTHDLVSQVAHVAKKISGREISILDCHSGMPSKRVKKYLSTFPVDVIITTPSHLLYLVEKKMISLRNLEFMCLDEADTLMDKSFIAQTSKIFNIVNTSLSSSRRDYRPYTLMVSATIPETMLKKINELIPNEEIITRTSPLLHRHNPKISIDIVRIKSKSNKMDGLITVLKENIEKDDRTIIFCNKTAMAEQITKDLKKKRFNVHLMASSVLYKQRQTIMQNFVKPNSINAVSENKLSKLNEEYHITDDSTSSKKMIIVANDIISRGMDTSAVTHVILYDFPHTMIDFIHRTGRTARMRSTGRVTCLVTNKDVKHANELMHAIRAQESLSKLSRINE